MPRSPHPNRPYTLGDKAARTLNAFLSSAGPLYALGAALARCWPVLLVLVLGPATLALLPQGRQALFVIQNSDAVGPAIYLYGTALLAIGIYPMILLDAVRRPRPSRAWLYAKYTVPQLIAATAGYALPLLVRYKSNIDLDVTTTGGGANAALGGLLLFIEFIAVASVIVPAGMMVQHIKSDQAESVRASLYAIGAAWGLAWFLPSQWMIARYAVLMLAILAANAFFDDAYMFASAWRKVLKSVALVLFILAALVVWVAIRLAVAPDERAPWWGPFGVVLVAMLGWLCIAYIIDWILWRLARRAVFRAHPAAIATLRVAVFGLIAYRLATGAFGNTLVATLPVPADAKQQTLAAYLDDWLKARAPKPGAPPYPVVIVAAEGGGIRAAYWTANVLAALHDANPQFAQHVLALSGVSGGSMGTSVYAALAAGGGAPYSCAKENRIAPCAQAVGGADLLSAPLAAMLLSEPLNRISARIPGADRAAALDRALEHAWQTATGDNRFVEPFGKIAADRMLVLPNSTSAATAQRVVITPLDAQKEFADALTIDGRAFSFSTATLLSARFPGLSPAGVYTPKDGEPMRIVDGGYGDNSGTATAAEMLTALNEAIERTKLGGRFKPVVIAISNGSEIVEKDDIDGFRSTTAGIAFDPVATLESLRVSGSRRYEAALCRQVTAQGGEYLRVPLLHRQDEFPLGWMLAPATTKTMNERIAALAQDAASGFARAVAVLRADAEKKRDEKKSESCKR